MLHTSCQLVGARAENLFRLSPNPFGQLRSRVSRNAARMCPSAQTVKSTFLVSQTSDFLSGKAQALRCPSGISRRRSGISDGKSGRRNRRTVSAEAGSPMGPGAPTGRDVNGAGSVNGASGTRGGGGVNGGDGASVSSGVNAASGVDRSGGVNGGPGVNRRSGVNGARETNSGGGANGARVDDTGFANWVRREFNVTREALRISRNKKADDVVEKEREKSNGAASTSGREKFVDSVFGDEDDWTEEMEEAWRFEARGFDEQDLKIRDPGKEGGPLIIDLPREEGQIQTERTADIWNLEDWREPRKIKQGSWDVYDVMKEQAETEETEGPKSKEAAVKEYLELLQSRKRRELYKDYEPAEENERLQLPIGDYKGPDTFRESFEEVGEPLQNAFQEVYALMHAFSVEMPFPLRTLVDERILNYGTYFW